jgi:hypothetical protein
VAPCFDEALTQSWPSLVASCPYRWDAGVNFPLGAIMLGCEDDLGRRGAVIAIG